MSGGVASTVTIVVQYSKGCKLVVLSSPNQEGCKRLFKHVANQNNIEISVCVRMMAASCKSS